MKPIRSRGEETSGDPAVTTNLKDALRRARVQLSVFNHHVGSRAGVRDVDFDTMDLISIHAPLSPSALARLAGVHPATLTGILDRLERGGWIARDRDASNRRGVTIRMIPERNADVLALYSGLDAQIDALCGRYDDTQLEVIRDFLHRVHDAAA